MGIASGINAAREGEHCGVAVKARVNTTPSRASRSMTGVEDPRARGTERIRALLIGQDEDHIWPPRDAW